MIFTKITIQQTVCISLFKKKKGSVRVSERQVLLGKCVIQSLSGYRKNIIVGFDFVVDEYPPLVVVPSSCCLWRF